MDKECENILQLVEDEKATSEDFANAPLPEKMRAVTVHRDEEHIFDGLTFREKDPRKSLHLDEVPIPELGPGEVLVAVMASAVNFNNVWSSVFEPQSGFAFLGDFSKMRPQNKKHYQDFHIVGSDASGVIVRVHPSVQRWKPGDRVTIFGNVCDTSDPMCFLDSVRADDSRAWGFETNYGAFAYFTVVQQVQLLPKAEHLSWEEAASINLVATTAYRMLVSDNGAKMKQGENVLIWGAAGGLGCYAIQLVLNGGGTPVAIVSTEKKAEVVRKLGCERVIVLKREPGKDRFLDEDGNIRTQQVLRLKAKIRRLTGGEDCSVVFEHTGRSTFAASVAVAARGGRIVTCGSTSGYQHVFDNRYLWQPVKRVIGSHGANYSEANELVRLVRKGQIMPLISRVFGFDDAANAVWWVFSGRNVGKVAILNMAQKERTGIRDWEMRERIGEERLNILKGMES